MAIDWVNYGDHELGKTSKKYTIYFRYVSMLYYGVLNLGANEYGPVNFGEYTFCILTLIFSSIIVAVVFGDVAMLISSLSD